MAEGFGSSVLGSERFQLRQQAGYLFHDGSGISFTLFCCRFFGITDSSIAGNLLPVTGHPSHFLVDRLHRKWRRLTIASLFQLHQIWSVMEQHRGLRFSTVLIDPLLKVVASRHDRPPVHRNDGKTGLSFCQITDIWLEGVATVSVQNNQF